jgi:mannose/cellobiose epimerase-like protein (N-acyl-D-glucosamine 2-epimerase family)
MKRREFLTAASAGGAALLAEFPGCGGTAKEEMAQTAPATLHAPLLTDEFKPEKFSIAELQQLEKQYEYDLFEDFLPFMEKHVIDHQYGGFMCTADRDGTNLSTVKSTWYEGRGIWVYSFLYGHLDPNPKFLEVARKSAEFILKHKPEGDNLWPSSFTREGKPVGAPDARTYGDMFVAAGLAEYAHASKNEALRKTAKDILLKCLRLYDKPDFWPEAARSYLGPEAPLTPGARVLGPWFVLLNTSSGMLEHENDPEILAVADRCLDAIMNYHHNPEFDLLNEILNHDLFRPANSLAQFVYTGHAIETLWMVMAEAARREDKTLFELAAKRFKRHVEVAWDGVYGGVFRSLNHVDKNIWLVDKALWAQEEVLVGSLLAAERTGWKWAKDLFIKAYNYVHEKWPLAKRGYALWDCYTDRKVTFVEHYNRVENYHHPRHLMLNLLALRRMLKENTGTHHLSVLKSGQISDVSPYFQNGRINVD